VLGINDKNIRSGAIERSNGASHDSILAKRFLLSPVLLTSTGYLKGDGEATSGGVDGNIWI
jgi:hypothetical protein